MNKLDAMYRAFKEYRKETDERNLNAERKALRKNNEKLEYFKVRKYLCTIEEDWIKAIEDGLVYVEKAIAEERQFIRVNGETVPIEKAKKISRDSVVHLAKHSQLISRVPENPEDTLVPDEIYVVEKLSDYAVYENRFLYMLLIQLQEFIAMRLDKIKKLRMTYVCDYGVKKEIKGKYRTLNVVEDFHEERIDNPYPLPDETCNKLVKRIEDIGICVNSYLKTNLMIEVAKAPMVKPPITKTNVLKMNNNFKNCLALYDYICAYKKDGYTAEEIEKDYLPLPDEVGDYMTEPVMLLSHLTYQYGNEITELLEAEYQKEEERRRILEQEKLIERIAKLKKRVTESGSGMEEYMLALEERNKSLEKDSEDLKLARKEIEDLNQKILDLQDLIEEHKRKIEELNQIIEDKNKEIAYLNQKYIDDMNALKLAHAKEMAELEQSYEEQLDEQKNLYEERIANLMEAHEAELADLKASHEEEMEELKKAHEEEIVRLNESIAAEYQDTITAHLRTIDEKNAEIESLNQNIMDLRKSNEDSINSCNERINEITAECNEKVSEYEDKMRSLENDYLSQIKNINDINASESLKLNQAINQLTREKVMITAEYNAIRVQSGKLAVSDDYTSKERFDELEREFEAFNQFFKAEWKRTKRAIRKKLLWTKEEKEALKKDPDFKAEPKDVYKEENTEPESEKENQ